MKINGKASSLDPPENSPLYPFLKILKYVILNRRLEFCKDPEQPSKTGKYCVQEILFNLISQLRIQKENKASVTPSTTNAFKKLKTIFSSACYLQQLIFHGNQ